VESPCPLCARLALPDLTVENELALAFKDAFSVNPGHTLIVSRRHVAGLDNLTPSEFAVRHTQVASGAASAWGAGQPEVDVPLQAAHRDG
jgi:diadenosine tetraphosphate (Ap4A) HIT family hydrolase